MRESQQWLQTVRIKSGHKREEALGLAKCHLRANQLDKRVASCESAAHCVKSCIRSDDKFNFYCIPIILKPNCNIKAYIPPIRAGFRADLDSNEVKFAQRKIEDENKIIGSVWGVSGRLCALAPVVWVAEDDAPADWSKCTWYHFNIKHGLNWGGAAQGVDIGPRERSKLPWRTN